MSNAEYLREYRKTHPDLRDRRAYTKAYRKTAAYRAVRKKYRSSQKFRIANRTYLRRQRRIHPLKLRARDAVKLALENGRLKKPDSCSSCNREGLVTAHHKDYSKPLLVIWLCPQCHSNEHNNRH